MLLAAGGVSDGRGLAASLALGADAAVLGGAAPTLTLTLTLALAPPVSLALALTLALTLALALTRCWGRGWRLPQRATTHSRRRRRW